MTDSSPFQEKKPLNRYCVVTGDKQFFSFIRLVSALTGQKNITDLRSDKIHMTLSPHSESSLLDYCFPFCTIYLQHFAKHSLSKHNSNVSKRIMHHEEKSVLFPGSEAQYQAYDLPGT